MMTKKRLILLLMVVCFYWRSFAYGHPGHVPHSSDPSLEMTAEQRSIYKKTIAAALDFFAQFDVDGKNPKSSWPNLKNELIFSYNHPYRNRGFCNAFAMCRNDYVGIKLKDLHQAQQAKFLELMQTLLAPYGYQKMEKVFSRQPIIFEIEQASRDNPEKFPTQGGPTGTPLEGWRPVDAQGIPVPRDADDYYIAFFGDVEQFVNGRLPLNQGFAIRVEGHHLSLNFTFFNQDNHLMVSTSPTFYGSSPMVVPPAPESAPNKYQHWKLQVGDTFMLSETQIAKLFVKALNPEEQKLALYSHLGSPMFEAAAEQKPLDSKNFSEFSKAGLPISALKGDQQDIEQKKYLLTEFLKLISATQRATWLNSKDIEADLNNMRIYFYGSTNKFDAFYFRVQSPQFLVELVQSSNFSVVNNGQNDLYNNNHVHIMFRDLRNDWGYDPMHLHEKLDHRDSEIYYIKPVKPIAELLPIALAAKPPIEKGTFRQPDLVELTKLDPAIKLDIRYATNRNLIGTPVYQQARAFMQRPAAQALMRAQQELAKQGYGLMVFDAYRPWYVTKLFWDAVPQDQHRFVADPAEGSRHNRGSAVDLTLFDLKTGRPIKMPSLYDETTERAYPTYTGGATETRRMRDLLRQYMEAQGFEVHPYEWWHFDYRDWKSYPIQNVRFEELK